MYHRPSAYLTVTSSSFCSLSFVTLYFPLGDFFLKLFHFTSNLWVFGFRAWWLSGMWPLTSPGRSGSAWTQLRGTCTWMWCWRIIETWSHWVRSSAWNHLESPLCSLSFPHWELQSCLWKNQVTFFSLFSKECFDICWVRNGFFGHLDLLIPQGASHLPLALPAMAPFFNNQGAGFVLRGIYFITTVGETRFHTIFNVTVL